ncbi:hypothetical protein PFLA_a4340 [Pseudoalteromonas flavipulchra NCIMB 2033 = ATCC BAA-314]|nr:hypothetical protein [Pseudoalteromonas flavipulchra NCIMB 2033 = ATCC BAA-314]
MLCLFAQMMASIPSRCHKSQHIAKQTQPSKGNIMIYKET